jgi:hypothetical protein
MSRTNSRAFEASRHSGERLSTLTTSLGAHLVWIILLVSASAARVVHADTLSILADRAVIRYGAPELGGAHTPQFIFERELSFEARLQAIADPDHPKDAARPFLDRHVRNALERHVAESLLANLRVDPVPTEAELAQQTDVARRILCDRVGGDAALNEAAMQEGMSDREVTNMLRRQARASIYLDRMVAPMLTPTRTELRQVYAVERHPFAQQSFEEAELALKRWWVGHRLADAVEQFFTNARQRVTISLLIENRDASQAEDATRDAVAPH